MLLNIYDAERNAATALADELKAQEQRRRVRQAQELASVYKQHRARGTWLVRLIAIRSMATRRSRVSA